MPVRHPTSDAAIAHRRSGRTERRSEMTTRLLPVISTPRGLASNTGRVSSALLEAILEEDEDVVLTTLDLFKTDLPSVAGRNIESKYKLMTGQALDEASLDSWHEIERTIEQFL